MKIHKKQSQCFKPDLEYPFCFNILKLILSVSIRVNPCQSVLISGFIALAVPVASKELWDMRSPRNGIQAPS